MQSTLRRGADDRLGDLPDCLLHRILSSLGSRQAVQTSVLSRRWGRLWRDVHCVAIDERDFAAEPWERFEDFADRMLTSIPLDTRLDAFRLHLARGATTDSYATYDRWIRRGLRHFPAAIDIRASHCTFQWHPHPSHHSAARKRPDSSVTGSCAAGFTRRVTTLRLVGVELAQGFLEDLGRHYPALQELHVERYGLDLLRAVASPTLRSLTVVVPRFPVLCPHLRIAAPLLSFLRLELPYDGRPTCYHCGAGEPAPQPEPLTSLVDASIRLTDMGHRWAPQNQREQRKHKLEFMKYIRSFLTLLPNVVKLHLTGFTTTALLEKESHEFPVLHSLKTLLLEECDCGLKFQALKSILSSTDNLENLGLHHCKFTDLLAKKRRKRGQQASKGRTSTPHVFWCKKLKSIEIKRSQDDAPVLAEVLSMIFKGMQPGQGMHPGQWQRVKTSITVVQRTQ